jgi:hypothetical protein
MNDAVWLVPMLCVLIFPVVWLIGTTLIRTLARMTRTLDVETGPLLRESPWGSASINGLGVNNAVKVAEYPTGWLLQMMWLAGGGKLWLHKPEVTVGELKAAGFLSPRSRTLTTTEHNVRLYGRLADFIA